MASQFRGLPVNAGGNAATALADHLVAPCDARLFRAVEDAARRAGPALFAWDEDDGVEVLAAAAWQRARAAAYCAALAFGAPDILTSDQNAELARPWISVFGSP